MDHRELKNTHAKLLALDLHSLTKHPTSSFSRVEILGVVASRELRPNKFLKFAIDDGTGCISCVLWLNHLTSRYFSRRSPVDVRLFAGVAKHWSSDIRIGVVARVRGRITGYRGAVQITVSDVVMERDPNAEILHWLDCISLSRNCYDVVTSGKPAGQNQPKGC